MRVIQTSVTADAEGVLRLAIPVGAAGASFDIAVVVEAKPTANGPGHKPTLEELGWPPGYFEKTFGSITDEAFVAPPRLSSKPIPPINTND